jgi:hypothetical protein
MRYSRYFAGIAAAAWITATGAAAENLTAPAPPKVESAPMAVPDPGDRAQVEKALEILRAHVDDLLAVPVPRDVDRMLSAKMMAFGHIEIEMAAVIMTYATDVELRRLAAAGVDLATQRIISARDWQTNQQILQQQLAPDAKP